MSAGKDMDFAIAKNKEKVFLRDNPAIKSNQNVYDFLSD